MNLDQIKKEFEEVKKTREPKRSRDLAFLMTQLEKNFDIPLLKRNTTEKHRNSPEFKLYLEISEARNL